MSTSSGAGGGAACPVCGASPMTRTGSLHGLPLLHCPACGHDCLWTTGVDLSAFYSTHYAGFREDPVFQRRVREVLATSIAELVPPRARVLDVGCGNGEFLLAAQELGHDVYGLDFSPAAAEACARRGVPAGAGDFLTHNFGLRAPFDLVTLWDVCEHLERPLDFAARACEVLAPGGWLVLKVPCFPPRAIRIAARVPRVAGALLGSPAHIQFFRAATLTHLLRRAGFRLVQVQPIPPMRSLEATTSPVKLAKRRLLHHLARVAGNESVLVSAQTPDSLPKPPTQKSSDERAGHPVDG
jgi:2-polyprenyl-3-methyl-5-hydroxy-6-metoxy-1,4-benzoquinol methylase